jgi:4-hydroxy-tetrahydrodipicolinate synthase
MQVAHGVDGLIIGGTTGEGQLMSWDEHIMLIAHTVNRCVLQGSERRSDALQKRIYGALQHFGRVWTLFDNAVYLASGSVVQWQSLETQAATQPGRLYMPPSRASRSVPNRVSFTVQYVMSFE